MLRDTDIFKGELLEVGKVNPFHQAIWELAFAEGSNAEGVWWEEKEIGWENLEAGHATAEDVSCKAE